jgi:hypothetical protein
MCILSAPGLWSWLAGVWEVGLLCLRVWKFSIRKESGRRGQPAVQLTRTRRHKEPVCCAMWEFAFFSACPPPTLAVRIFPQCTMRHCTYLKYELNNWSRPPPDGQPLSTSPFLESADTHTHSHTVSTCPPLTQQPHFAMCHSILSDFHSKFCLFYIFWQLAIFAVKYHTLWHMGITCYTPIAH